MIELAEVKKEFFSGEVRENSRMVSQMAETLIGSEVLRIAAEIRSLTAGGKKIWNLTVGDFSPSQFRIPEFLEEGIVKALKNGETNYPPSDGVPELRKAVQRFYDKHLGLNYPIGS